MTVLRKDGSFYLTEVPTRIAASEICEDSLRHAWQFSTHEPQVGCADQLERQTGIGLEPDLVEPG